MEVKIELDDAGAQKAFSDAIARGTDMRPLMQEIAEKLKETTKQRFNTSTAPDGSRWAPNSPATYLRYLSAFKTSFDKDSGQITSKGAKRAANKKPLIGEGGRWGGMNYTISSASGPDYLEIFSPKVYAAVHQFGNPLNRMFGGPLAPIPARPFLGISQEDEQHIEDSAQKYLAELL